MNEWISVNDRLPDSKPEKRVNYLCFDGYAMFVTEYREYKNGADFDQYFGIPTHWMPLPEPPDA